MNRQIITATFPPMVEGQDGWYLDSPSNRYLRGDNWIARDWFPKLYMSVRPPRLPWHRRLFRSIERLLRKLK